MDYTYEIITGTAIECQKQLNQWRHEYDIEVLGMSTDNGIVTILLTKADIPTSIRPY